MRAVHPTTVGDDGDVDAALGELESPDRLAGARLDAVDPAAAVSGHDQPLTVDHGNVRRRLGVLVGLGAGGLRHPELFAGTLVEGADPVERSSFRAPGSVREGDDQAVFIDQRGLRAPTVALHEAELLDEGVRPDDLAGPAVEAVEPTAHPLVVDVAGLRIAGHASPANPIPRHRRVIDVEAVLPELLAGFGVEAGDELLPLDALAGATTRADAAVEHHGGRASDEVLPPEQVLAVDRPARNEPGLRGGAVSRRTAPIRPVLGCRRQARRECGDERQPEDRCHSSSHADSPSAAVMIAVGKASAGRGSAILTDWTLRTAKALQLWLTVLCRSVRLPRPATR